MGFCNIPLCVLSGGSLVEHKKQCWKRHHRTQGHTTTDGSRQTCVCWRGVEQVGTRKSGGVRMQELQLINPGVFDRQADRQTGTAFVSDENMPF